MSYTYLLSNLNKKVLYRRTFKLKLLFNISKMVQALYLPTPFDYILMK